LHIVEAPTAAEQDTPSSAPSNAIARFALPLTLLGVAVAVWIRSLPQIEIRHVNDLGLLSVLPVGTLAAMALLTVSFCIVLLSRRPNELLLLIHVVALIVMLYAITTFVEQEPRFAVTWRHAGISQYVLDTGRVDPDIDAYFNWPGFFILGALLTKAAALKSVLSMAAWAPLVYNLMYLGPLLMICRTSSDDPRIVWFALWLFYATDWIGQDYFSPQGLAYFLYLVIIAIVLRWFPGTTRAPGRRWMRGRLRGAVRRFLDRLDRPDPGAVASAEKVLPARRAALALVLIAVFAALVPMHQLTPFAVLAAVATLVLVNRSSFRSLPVLFAVLIGTWISFMAVSYFAGHSADVTGQAGNVHETLNQNLGRRLQGSSLHLIVVYTRIGLTACLWVLAAYGARRWFRRRGSVLPYAALAIAPFPIILLQPYGGEILLRVYLFSLPFMVVLASAAMFGRPRTSPVVLLVVALAFLPAFLVARYGNEKMDYFTHGEVEAVDHLYAAAPPGSSLFALQGNLPWKFKGYASYRYNRVTPSIQWERITGRPQTAVRGLADLMGARPVPAFLIVTRSQAAAAEMTEGVAASTVSRFEDAIASSPRFETIYRNRDARVFMLRRTGAAR
jgi:hypothetical protein